MSPAQLQRRNELARHRYATDQNTRQDALDRSRRKYADRPPLTLRERQARGWASCQARKDRKAEAVRRELELGHGLKRAAYSVGISERHARRLKSELGL